MPITLTGLRRFAVTRSLFPPTTLQRALDRLGFVQADPIRAPARAQDLTLRHRVEGYRAGDLERAYATLDVEEDVLVNYGFLTPAVHGLMHPRRGASSRSLSQRQRIEAILGFVRTRGAVHPREVDDHFSHGTVKNYWGGFSNATTHLLDAMHYQGLLRVVRRDGGIRVYAERQGSLRSPADMGDPATRLDGLVDVVVNTYGPLPSQSLSNLVGRLRYGVPQWRRALKPALQRARLRLSHARVDGVEWYWPTGETITTIPPAETVHLLGPFDPVVWDRRRFERFWGWAYRFEAYTPVSKRTRGYYALPLLWRERAIGWGNVSVKQGAMAADVRYVTGRAPRGPRFAAALDAELERLRAFLGLGAPISRS